MTAAEHSDHVADALRRALGSQYEVLGLLGRGGMGAVYHAREVFLERDVAVKVLPADLASGDARERFLREARTAARLSHPNIVPLHTFGQADDLLYYVMGHVDGETLEARLRREGRLSLEETCRITSELADALEYAHQMGVVHRDVKPDNVLLDRQSGRAMLTDFGIAKQRAGAETLTQTGVIVGTPHYMSPEQASGERDLDGRSDLYSLGVIAYRMATGRLPFEGADLRDVLVQHVTRAPLSPAQLVSTIPPNVEMVITRALAKAPGDRWPNARAMREALAPESEDSLPDPLRNITGMGPRLIVLSAACLELAFLGHRWGWFDAVMTTATTVSGLVIPVIGALGLVRPVRRHGWRATLRHFMRQPGWWSGWWPAFGRRTGDVWERLPRSARFIRVVTASGMLANLALLNFMMYGMTEHIRTGVPTLMKTFTWVAAGLVATWLATLIPASIRLRRRAVGAGLSRAEVEHVLGGVTWGSVWQRPHVAALLDTPGPRAVAGDRRQPADIRREIDTLARAEASSPHAEVYREAAAAAAAMAAAIATLEKELAQLARDSDPREHERIQASLAALGERERGESLVKAQMRELLERQVSLFSDISRQRELLAARRDHLVEALRTLALHVAHLRAAASPAAASDVTGRIRAVCREVDYRMAGAREANAVVT